MVKNTLLIYLLTFAALFAQSESSSSAKTDFISGSISVTLGGAFATNGSFPASPMERADQLITRIITTLKAQSASRPEKQNATNPLIEEFAKRDIQLKRADGQTLIIDLEKFRLTGDYSYNPFLKNEDVLIFPNVDLLHGFVSVFGAVNSAGHFQFVEGDRLSDAVLFAHGLNKSYEDSITVIISRLAYNGEQEEIHYFKVTDNPLLQRGDRITFQGNESQRKDYKVLIAGEVNSPGYIPITKNNTTIKDLIVKAGGVTYNADLNRAELIRGANAIKSPIFSQDFDLMMMQRMSDISKEDSTSFMVDNRLRFSRGNGTVDFEKIFSDNAEGAFLVKDGDYIFIPEKQSLVYIYGQVNNPGYINFVPGESYNYYINKAGGIAKTAKDEIFIIKGKAKTWVKIEKDVNIVLEPGDFIWIPKQPQRDFNFYVTRTGAIASIIGTIATILVLLIQVTK